jgi:hypothetical protein
MAAAAKAMLRLLTGSCTALSALMRFVVDEAVKR